MLTIFSVTWCVPDTNKPGRWKNKHKVFSTEDEAGTFREKLLNDPIPFLISMVTKVEFNTSVELAEFINMTLKKI